MTKTPRRVAITGLGLITPCGKGWRPFWQAFLESRSSISYLSRWPSEGFPVTLAGQIENFDPTEYVKNRKSLKVMSRETVLAVAASQLAIEDSGINLAAVDRTRFGISLGTGIINNDLDEIGVGIRSSLEQDGSFSMKKFGQDGIRALYPLWMLKYMPNMPACHISMVHGLRGPSNTVTTSSAASAHAIGEAVQVIKRGDADMMLAGGTDSKLNAMGLSRFQLLGLLSRQNHIPGKAYCPFDQRHDGIVIGEGAGLVLVEEYHHAKARGARIYGEVAGYGSSSDYNYDPRITEDFNGKRLGMVRALEQASVEPREIDLLFANGSGIPLEDKQESSAIKEVFEGALSKLKVTGSKPITGHLIYGSGGVELAAAVLSLYHGVIPALANLESPDTDCDLPFVLGDSLVFQSRHALFNSFGFGGQNATVVLRK
ncbi:MAG: hypothetical protein A2Z83_04865 [Omnitrophica bacterium GWA2_52_8]|nr:MAG: hypothetical protein A2Z83_04865 [Omnitrophica bacterium GWA2_52_8]